MFLRIFLVYLLAHFLPLNVILQVVLDFAEVEILPGAALKDVQHILAVNVMLKPVFFYKKKIFWSRKNDLDPEKMILIQKKLSGSRKNDLDPGKMIWFQKQNYLDPKKNDLDPEKNDLDTEKKDLDTEKNYLDPDKKNYLDPEKKYHDPKLRI